MITIPLWMGLKGLVVSFAIGVTSFMGFVAIVDVSSSILDKEEDSSASFNNLL